MKGVSRRDYGALLDPKNLVLRALKSLPGADIAEPDGTGVRRVAGRLGIDADADLEGLSEKAQRLANGPCTARNPDCAGCPLRGFCPTGRQRDARSPRTSKLTFVDLFSGAGGLSLGFEYAGFEPVYAADHDEASVATYRFNRPSMATDAIECVDLSGSLKKMTGIDLLIGGPPCQGFSNANRQAMPVDKRNSLYRAFIDGVATYSPRLVVLENVPGIARSRQVIQRDFAQVGFIVEPFLVDAANLGLPQRRKRLFWLGVPDTSMAPRLFAQFAASLDSRPWDGSFTLTDAIGSLPALERQSRPNSTGYESPSTGYMLTPWQAPIPNAFEVLVNRNRSITWLFNHKSKYLNDRDALIYERLTPGETSNADWFSEVDPYPTRRHIFKDKFSRLTWDEPARTMTAHMYYDCHMYIHPTQARGLTPREAARIQGFPDDYLFLGYPNEWYRQIGNAVSPIVAEVVGQAVVDVLDLSRQRGAA